MSIRKVDKNKYKIEVEKKINKQCFRKTKTVICNLKGIELKSFLNQEEINPLDQLKKSIVKKSELINYTFK